MPQLHILLIIRIVKKTFETEAMPTVRFVTGRCSLSAAPAREGGRNSSCPELIELAVTQPLAKFILKHTIEFCCYITLLHYGILLLHNATALLHFAVT